MIALLTAQPGGTLFIIQQLILVVLKILVIPRITIILIFLIIAVITVIVIIAPAAGSIPLRLPLAFRLSIKTAFAMVTLWCAELIFSDHYALRMSWKMVQPNTGKDYRR
jgi:hypothetical protein